MNRNRKITTVPLLLLLLFYGCSAGDVKEAEQAPTASAAMNGYTRIRSSEAMDMMNKDDGYIVVDVRTMEEYKEGHIPGAICIPNESILEKQPEELPDLGQVILVYCQTGNRSQEAAKKLAQIGYRHVYDFGGIVDWPGDIETNLENTPAETEDDAIIDLYGTWVSETGNLTLSIFEDAFFNLTRSDGDSFYGKLQFTDEERGMWMRGPRYELVQTSGAIVYDNANVSFDDNHPGQMMLAYGGGAELLNERCAIGAGFAEDGMRAKDLIVDEGASAVKIVLVSNRDLNDFMFVSLALKNVTEDGKLEFDYETLYTTDVFRRGVPFSVQMAFLGDSPNHGFFYTDTDGVMHLYTLTLSGLDGSVEIEEIGQVQ
ncbi:MAG: rhodanese-like domain-containing protein [Bulleidia sp.]